MATSSTQMDATRSVAWSVATCARTLVNHVDLRRVVTESLKGVNAATMAIRSKTMVVRRAAN